MLTPEQSDVVNRLRIGGVPALTSYFIEQRPQLRKLVNDRIAPALAARIDGSDVVQEAFLTAQKEFQHFISNPKTSPVTWLQRICLQTLSNFSRRHVASQSRTIERETQLENISEEGESERFVDDASTPSAIIGKAERVETVLSLIESMKENDREILLAVHIHDLTLRQAAERIGIAYETAKKRYRRAILRLSRMAKPHQ